MESIKKILIISSEKSLLEVLNFCFDGWGYEVVLRDSILNDIAEIKKISPDCIVVDVHSANKSHLEICRMLKDDFLTSFIPVITLINKRQLRSQLLNIKQGVDDYLIKPPDPLDLRIRVEMALKRAQYSFHVNPLTGLPGARILEDTLSEKIKKQVPFTFGYIDIDNFKYYNDVYGYVKGDMAIMQAAYMLYTVVKKCGNPEDFIGHIGGDDFVFISTPDKYKDISQNFILMFDRAMPFHYTKHDRQLGYIIARDRTHKIKEIPLMSVSVALINKDNPSEYNNIVEITECIAEIKRFLKGTPGSKFMADRRNIKAGQPVEPVVSRREQIELYSHKLLGQILLDKNIITVHQLDEALKLHWRKGIILGEVLREMKFTKDEEINEALKLQNAQLADILTK